MSYSALSPELVVSNADEAIEWYCKVFDGKEEFKMKTDHDDKVMHSLVRLCNGATIFVIDDFPEQTDGASAVRTQDEAKRNNVTISITVDDVRSVWDRAIAAGAKQTMALKKQFWGRVYGRFVDPYGHHWAIDEPESKSGSEPEAKEPLESKPEEEDATKDDTTKVDATKESN